MSIYSKALFKKLIPAICIGLFISHSQVASAASQEDKVKTAIIYKITKFVTWPQKAEA